MVFQAKMIRRQCFQVKWFAAENSEVVIATWHQGVNRYGHFRIHSVCRFDVVRQAVHVT